MNIKFNIRLLWLTGIVLSIGLATSSCQKDNSDVNNGMVELLSFGPSGVKLGDQITFIGKNLDKVTTIVLKGDSVQSASFVSQSADNIVIIVPQKTERGAITLRTAKENIVSKTVLDLLVPVTITSITPSVRPGDNITIAGNYLNWVSEVWFTKDLVVKTFESKSLTQLVVKVPIDAKSGPLVMNTKGTKPLSLTSDKDLIVTLPAITSFGPIPVDIGANLTITGTNLDLTKEVRVKGATAPITTFVSKSATQLVVKIPPLTTKGLITLVAYSGVTIDSQQKLLIVGDLPDLAPVSYAFYEDALMNGWSDWGWGGPRDFKNTENVRDGDKAIKVTCDGSWGALYLGGGNVSLATYTEFTFALFGKPGTNGKVLKVAANWGSQYDIVIQEGKWVEYKLTKANLGNPTKITDLVFQEAGWAGVYYIDHIGLR
ncbi:MAG: IPT/TIG domain-containing protein [Bacteroidia bacterium]|nr:IPT/TIG domain-containing protein [Bacteroidia bacterium]